MQQGQVGTQGWIKQLEPVAVVAVVVVVVVVVVVAAAVVAVVVEELASGNKSKINTT